MAFSPWRLAMRRSTCSKRVTAALVLIAVLTQLTALPAAADDAAAIEAGRAAGRSLLILRDPKVCGIALLRDRRRSDVDAFLGGKSDADFKDVPKIGPHPASGLRAFVADGDRDAFDNALGFFNSRSATPEMWTSDARGAALFDAGVEDVLLPAARGNFALEVLSSGPTFDLFEHAARIPHGALPVALPAVPRETPTPAAGPKKLPGGALITTFAHDLVTAIDAAMPPPPLLTIAYADGAAGDAALGVASSTMAELIDSPDWLFQADAQRFVDAYAAHLVRVAPAQAARIAEFRAAVRSNRGFSHDAALDKHTAMSGAVMTATPARTKPFLLGLLAAQLVYNAAILRNRDTATAMANVLSEQPGLDASIAGWSEVRHTASAGAEWGAQYRLGLRLVDLIRKANAR
jgi:hypothetical protein